MPAHAFPLAAALLLVTVKFALIARGVRDLRREARAGRRGPDAVRTTR